MLPQYPKKLLSPFAQNGDKSEIPAITPQGTNAFSYNAGFPTITGQPLSVGGLPPSREDFNAAFNMMSEWIYYMQCGGQVEYSEEVDYPENARVFYNGTEYLCLKENGNNTENGVQALSNVEYWQAIAMPSPYVVGEFKQFLLQSPPSGFLVLNGALIENASLTVPNLWDYLQTNAGSYFCITEEEWQEQSTATPFKGIGGVCAYVIDIEENTIRLPDLRGMYAESSGFDGLEIGDVHGDMIRPFSLLVDSFNDSYSFYTSTFYNTSTMSVKTTESSFSHGFAGANVTKKRTTTIEPNANLPTGNANKPRAYAMLHCVYVGTYNRI